MERFDESPIVRLAFDYDLYDLNDEINALRNIGLHISTTGVEYGSPQGWFTTWEKRLKLDSLEKIREFTEKVAKESLISILEAKIGKG